MRNDQSGGLHRCLLSILSVLCLTIMQQLHNLNHNDEKKGKVNGTSWRGRGELGQGSFEHCSKLLSLYHNPSTPHPHPPSPARSTLIGLCWTQKHLRACVSLWRRSIRNGLPVSAPSFHPPQLTKHPPQGDMEERRDAGKRDRERKEGGERREGCYVTKSFELVVSWLVEEKDR